MPTTEESALAEKIREAYQIARGERLAELRGHRPRLLDDRGIHPYSYLWGQIDLLGGSELAHSPEALRRDARAEADEAFRQEVIEEWQSGADKE